MKKALTNAVIFDGNQLQRGKALLLDQAVVTGITNDDAVPADYEKEDLGGDYLSPSFIDLQIYGGNGKMFSQHTNTEALAATYEYCKAGGCADFMITIATNSIEKFIEGMEAVRAYWQQGGKGLLGLHLEGPYLNPLKKGAHVEQFIKQPTLEEVKMLIDKGRDVFKMITLAPECCDHAVIELLQQNKILVSAGHTNASYQQATEAFNRGIPVATHLYNAMSPLQHRAPGIVGAIFDHPAAMSSVVCDGVHADFSAVRIAKRIMKERLFYITDAVTEVKEGAYVHLFKGTHYTLPDGTLSGSSLTMMRCVQNGVEQLGITLEESLRMASTYPASLLKQETGACIEKGRKAKLLVFDKEYQVKKLIGEI